MGELGANSQEKKPGATTKVSSHYANKKRTDVVEMCARNYTEDPRPRRLGKMYAFCYNKKNEPRIVVGPDYCFSLLELALVNGILGLVVHSLFSHELWTAFSIGFFILLAHDISFIATVTVNPGLAPRNPNAHSKGYLNYVKTIE